MLNNRRRDDASSKAADLLKKAMEAQQEADKTLGVVKEAAHHISLVGRGIKKIGEGFTWANDHVIDPALSFAPFLKSMGRSIGRQYAWFCYPSEPFHKAVWRGFKNSAGRKAHAVSNLFRSEKTTYEPSLLPLGDFSRSRAGIATLVTAFAATPIAQHLPIAGEFIPDMVSDTAYELIYEPPYDAARMGMTALFNGGSLHKETIYLNGKNEIDPKNDVWSVGGCETKPGCESEDAVSFHIKPSMVHHAWSLSTGRGPFLSDYVAVPIPNTPSKCEVISYGLRWRISKWANSYPVLLNAQCQSISGAELALP